MNEQSEKSDLPYERLLAAAQELSPIATVVARPFDAVSLSSSRRLRPAPTCW